MNPKLTASLIVSVTAAIVLLALTSTYSAWVSSTQHNKSCASRALILDTFHDVIQLAFTPQPGQTLTAMQVKRIQAFEASAFARIDQARC